MKGKFIVFEGIDGAGKSTQISKLEAYLKSIGRKVCITSEPTLSVTGGALRDALSGNYERSSAELAAMFLADRVFHNINKNCGIIKMLDDGFDVISDRYYYSSFAYQGIESDLKWVMDMNLNCPEIIKPDLCIFLDLDAENSQKRINENRANVEIFEEKSILENIRNKFFVVFELLTDENIKIINAANDIDTVFEAVKNVANDLFV